ncbi:GFA family protein [Devosia sediminis]|uniref:GFA family protein n=1 Tax=Devosia sediminis TaxID=2798801 RepID=A0A934IT42_9HYPH|nr:GFA family protein [Devosia sediminis]MBJ3783832.1 GFA family protein [Devosia sediminis]
MALPEFPVDGGCSCGSARYRLKAAPLSVYNCHCKDCQRYSGAGWSMSVLIKGEDLELVSGSVVQHLRRADSGNVITMNFCAACHTWLWNDPASGPYKVLRAGSLDDIDWAAPVGNIWTDSKAAWAKIDPAQVNFPKGATDRTPLIDAFTRLHQD